MHDQFAASSRKPHERSQQPKQEQGIAPADPSGDVAMGGSHGVDQWNGLVHALLRGHWENIPAELRAGLDSLLKLPPTEPSKNERVAEITKRFKEANGRLRDLGQKRLQLKPGFKK